MTDDSGVGRLKTWERIPGISINLAPYPTFPE